MDNKDLQAISELLDKKLEPIKTQLDENTQILKSLTKASETHKADVDNLTHQIAELNGEMKEARKDLSRIEIATAENWTDIAKLKAVK